MVIDKIAFLERKLAEAEGEDNDGYLQGFWERLCPDCDATHDQSIEWTQRLIAALKDDSYQWDDDGESPPSRKFRGEAYACYGTAPVEFEFEAPAGASPAEIEAAANMAALDEVQVTWYEVHPPKPRKKKTD